MDAKLQILYNTLLTIETKGQSTKTMADCLKYIEQLITESKENKKVVSESEVVEEV